MKPTKRRLALRSETIRQLTRAELYAPRGGAIDPGDPGATDPAGSDYDSCITLCLTRFPNLCTTMPWRTAAMNCTAP